MTRLTSDDTKKGLLLAETWGQVRGILALLRCLRCQRREEVALRLQG